MTALSPIVVISRDAREYAEVLAPQLPGNPELLLVTPGDAIPPGAARATVALGEPGALAAALGDLPELAWAQSTWAGLTPLVPAAAAGLAVTGVKGVFGPAMAEFVLGQMLAHALDLPGRLRAQARRHWDSRPTRRLAGKTLGIMGTGSIGAEVARRARALDLTPIGLSRRGRATSPFDTVYGIDGRTEFLSRCHYLVGVLPDTPDTRGLLDADAFAALPRGAFLVNVGRGSLVVEADLLAALESGRLGGAALDVFAEEPLAKDHPFWDAPGVTVTAHVAARSWPADIAAIFLDNLERYRGGRPLRHRLDPAAGY